MFSCNLIFSGELIPAMVNDQIRTRMYHWLVVLLDRCMEVGDTSRYYPGWDFGPLKPTIAMTAWQCWQINAGLVVSQGLGIAIRNTHWMMRNRFFAWPWSQAKSRARLNPFGKACCKINMIKSSPRKHRVFVTRLSASTYSKVTNSSSQMMRSLLMTPQ